MHRLVYTLVLIISGLAGGYILQQIIREKSARHEHLLPRLRKFLQRFSILGLMPISFVGAFWIIPFDDPRIALLPVIGSGVILLGGVLGIGTARLLKISGAQKSALFCCGSFSNFGSLGGLTSFLFFGEKGFALLTLYRIFEEVIYYGIGFPIARFYRGEDENPQTGSRLLELIKDPFFIVAIGSFLTGLSLNLSGAHRPPAYETLISIFVPVGVFLILVSVGLGMRFSKVRDHIAEGAAISLIKFIILPLVAVTASYLLGLHKIQNALPMKIVLIGSSMPVAFLALVAASIYDLDLELANSCWLITTGSMLLVLPWLYFLCSLF
jgi:predicted permease